ncbi:MAG: hypothetical protein US70_C0008G0028 [Parcubacteria group bacterium GW2011_GWD2_38_11]|nr:MAG: hypothetical protein US70_C0008G0028 [Parcubacteria group bacterium GW2011_GWD2_38_11]
MNGVLERHNVKDETEDNVKPPKTKRQKCFQVQLALAFKKGGECAVKIGAAKGGRFEESCTAYAEAKIKDIEKIIKENAE